MGFSCILGSKKGIETPSTRLLLLQTILAFLNPLPQRMRPLTATQRSTRARPLRQQRMRRTQARGAENHPQMEVREICYYNNSAFNVLPKL